MRPTPRRSLMSRPLFEVAMAVLSVLCAAPSDCGGGSGGGLPTNAYVIPPQTTQALSVGDVDTIIRHAINEAGARGKPATIAVVDRLGNVLGVVRMPGAPTPVTVTSNRGLAAGQGLEGVAVPSTLAALSKAITGAFLSSGGNAFSTRTASQIVQEHFNPGVRGTPGGPLFGVQFSQLPCSDFNQYLSTLAGARANVSGPQRSPLGLSADPGGMPIYKNGVEVGGIGIVSKTTYTLDLNIFDFDQNTPAGDDDEIIAIAGLAGFEAPQPIQAQNISAGGVTLRYADASAGDLAAPVALAPEPFPGQEVAIAGFYNLGGPRAGVTWGSAAAGVFPDGSGFTAPFVAPGPAGAAPGVQYPGVVAWVFYDPATGVQRVPRAGFTPAGSAITALEARNLVISGLQVAYQTRGQIRIPTNSNAEISVAIVDLGGNLLAMARTTDAPVFGADVSIQKARSVVFFSRADARSAFNEISGITAPATAPSSPGATFAYYMSGASLGAPTLFSQGIAFSDRALGDLARPFYPDGIDGAPPGPLSLPFASWSPFADGLQLDLVKFDIVTYGAGGAAPPLAGCANGTGGNTVGGANNGLVPTPTPPEDGRTPLANGLQIFPGGVPIYRGGTLVGAIGISGDGVQQDDMVAFLGLQNYVLDPGQAVPLANAPSGIRADQLSPGGAPLSYVICPFAPFLNSRVQNAC